MDAADKRVREYYVCFVLDNYTRANGGKLHLTIAFPGKLTHEEAGELLGAVKGLQKTLAWPSRAHVLKQDVFGGQGVVTVRFEDGWRGEVIRRFHDDHTAADHVSKGDWTPHVTWKDEGLRDRLLSAGGFELDVLQIGIVGEDKPCYTTYRTALPKQ
jgi:hypothetical protein